MIQIQALILVVIAFQLYDLWFYRNRIKDLQKQIDDLKASQQPKNDFVKGEQRVVNIMHQDYIKDKMDDIREVLFKNPNFIKENPNPFDGLYVNDTEKGKNPINTTRKHGANCRFLNTCCKDCFDDYQVFKENNKDEDKAN